MVITHRNAPSPSLLSRLQTLVFKLQRWKHTSAGESGISTLRDATSNPRLKEGSFGILSWKTVDSRAVGIRRSGISPPTWTVLNVLQRKGFEAYLVGGCVRDLLLKKTPKDFDVITTASLKQIKRYFHRCMIVGRRFPICLVPILGSIVEVSSFDTTHKNVEDRKKFLLAEMPNCCDKKDIVRWKNCMERDFTINGLFYDPFVDTIYDYVNGISDLRTSKVRTVIPAHLSFKEDCARMLRGLRIVARLGLRFSKETAAAITDLSSSIITLAKSRLMMELNFMLAYGAAEPSIRLLQQFKLLDILLPVHAAYLADQTRKLTGESAIMLLKLFSNVDRLLAADRPSNCSLWLGLLAFHLALLYQPQDALVIWTFSSILYHGTWSKAVAFARESCKVHVQFSPEIVVPSGPKSDESLLEETSHFALLVKSSVEILTNTDALQCSLVRYPDPSPCFGQVFVSGKMGNSVKQLFDVLVTDTKSCAKKREASTIDYELLKKGDPDETRFVLGKIIMDTMKCATLIHEPNQNVAAEEKGRLDELADERNLSMAALVRSFPDERSREQNQNGNAMAERRRDELTREQNHNVAAPAKSHHRELAAAQNQKVGSTESSHIVELTGEHNQAAFPLKKGRIGELSGQRNQNVAAVKKHRKESPNVVSVDINNKQTKNVGAADKSCVGNLNGEQKRNVVAVEKICSGELSWEQKNAAEKRRRPLSALFK